MKRNIRKEIQDRADKMYDCAVAIKRSQEEPENLVLRSKMVKLQGEVGSLTLDMYE